MSKSTSGFFPAFLVALFNLLFTFPGYAQQGTVKVFGDSARFDPAKNVSLTGTITSVDKKPLQGAALFVDGLKYGNNSDAGGKYFISLPQGEYRLSVRFLGMAPIQTRIAMYGNGVLNFEMVEKPEALEEVVIRARKEDENVREPIAGVTKLSITEIKRMPAFMGEVDVVKNILLLPGVSTVGEGSAGFNVRGGRVDQNLVLMDDGLLLNSSHALGLLSNFNPDAIEDFTLYKGNVPAQFGGRASSVLAVRTRNGDFSKFKAKAGLGTLSGRIAVEGPIQTDKTSFLVAARFTYSDWILKQVNNVDVQNSAASFYDINGNLTHKFGKGNSLSLLYYLGHDYFRFNDKFGYEYSTQLITLRWKQILGEKLGSTMSLVSGTYKANLADLDVKNARNFSNGVNYLQFKESLLLTSGENLATNFGAEATVYSPREERSDPLGGNSSTVSSQVQKSRGIELAGFIDQDFSVSKAISIAAGLRYSFFQNYGPDTVYQYQDGASRRVSTISDTLHFAAGEPIKSYAGFEPRLSIRFGLNTQSSIKISYARLRQYMHLVSNTTATTPVDIWQVSNLNFLPQIGDNFSVGYFRNSKTNMYEMSAEVFYKTTANIPDYKDFSSILPNRHLETDVIQGDGLAYGLELYAKKNTGQWTGWISYTFMRSLVRMNGQHADEIVNQGKWYPSNYDKPHSFSITASSKLGKNKRFSTNFNYSTGRPISAIEAYYIGSNTSVPLFSERNQYRVPDYWRVDISVTFNSILKKFDDSLTISVYNLFGRANAYSIFYQQQEGIPTLQSYKLSVLGSALPSITYNISFGK
jgi:hypothetical protein